MRRAHGFTLVEIVLSIFILLLLLGLSVPSLTGVMADRRLRRSFDELNALVRVAQERSVLERRTYLIVWREDHLVVLPDEPVREGQPPNIAATLKLRPGDAYLLQLPAALVAEAPAIWAFWPAGVCEPATVSYQGVDGAWTANYSSLTARGNLLKYATK